MDIILLVVLIKNNIMLNFLIGFIAGYIVSEFELGTKIVKFFKNLFNKQ